MTSDKDRWRCRLDRSRCGDEPRECLILCARRNGAIGAVVLPTAAPLTSSANEETRHLREARMAGSSLVDENVMRSRLRPVVDFNTSSCSMSSSSTPLSLPRTSVRRRRDRSAQTVKIPHARPKRDTDQGRERLRDHEVGEPVGHDAIDNAAARTGSGTSRQGGPRRSVPTLPRRTRRRR